MLGCNFDYQTETVLLTVLLTEKFYYKINLNWKFFGF